MAQLKPTPANILALALYLADQVSEYFSHFQAYEKDKDEKLRLFGDSFDEHFRASITALEEMDGQAPGTKQKKQQATSKKQAASDTLATTLRGIREDVSIYFKDDENVKRAFGVGRVLTSPKAVLSTAAAVIASAKMPEFQAAGVAAGLTAERIATLTAQHARLKRAGTNASNARAEATDATAQKLMTFDEVKETNSTIRRVARRVFESQPRVLKRFLAVPQGTEERTQNEDTTGDTNADTAETVVVATPSSPVTAVAAGATVAPTALAMTDAAPATSPATRAAPSGKSTKAKAKQSTKAKSQHTSARSRRARAAHREEDAAARAAATPVSKPAPKKPTQANKAKKAKADEPKSAAPEVEKPARRVNGVGKHQHA